MFGRTNFERNATFNGLDYKRTTVDWVNFVRDLFQQWVVDNFPNLVRGNVEIDESESLWSESQVKPGEYECGHESMDFRTCQK